MVLELNTLITSIKNHYYYSKVGIMEIGKITEHTAKEFLSGVVEEIQ
jgi:hypothetical protein